MPATEQDLRQEIAWTAERVILSRIYNNRLEGYTLETSKEIADKILTLLKENNGSALSSALPKTTTQ